MSTLTRLALDVLQAVSAPPGLKSVACSTLLAAMDGNIEVPPGTQMAVWRFLLASDASAVVMHRHELAHPDVARAAVAVLLDENSGDAAQDLALATLRGTNVAEVQERDLESIADHVLDEGRVRRVTTLAEHVHEQRGLASDFVRKLRDRLAGSEAAAIRSGAVTVGALLPRLDVEFAHRMFEDASPAVRTAMADALEAVSDVDRDSALRLIRDQLGREEHRSPLSALYFALSTLVRAGGRRVRTWDPPDSH